MSRITHQCTKKRPIVAICTRTYNPGCKIREIIDASGKSREAKLTVHYHKLAH